ncbi:MAG: hypothetical protein ACOYKZ_01535 [Chlamydiia bacterium]
MSSPPRTGRYTLRGANGSGKTSLLLLLKQQLGDQAFFLPAKHNLMFQSHSSEGSTGQLLRRSLQEIQDNIRVPLVLLDEWDANLDAQTAQQVSGEIDTLAQACCVIESRHRNG